MKKIIIAILTLTALAIGGMSLFSNVFTVGKFRTTQDKILESAINTKGLEKLRVSGSHICSFPMLKKSLKDVKGPIYIIDTISREHGFIKGYPDLLFGYGNDRDMSWLHRTTYTLRRLVLTGSLDPIKDGWVSEEEEAKAHGFGYVRLGVDVVGTKTFLLDELIRLSKIIHELPKDAWLHIHCWHGKARTTIVMTALDIIANAPEVSVEDIVKRQKALGGEDLFNDKIWKNGTYTEADLKARKQLIIDFYDYVVAQKAKGLL